MGKIRALLLMTNVFLSMIIIGLIVFFGWQMRGIPFVQNLSATLIGVFVGAFLAVLGALWVDRRTARRRRLNRQQQLLQLLNETLEENKSIIINMENVLGEGDSEVINLVFHNVDVSLLNSTTSLKYEIIDDQSLNIGLERFRYNLMHIERLVSMQLEYIMGNIATEGVKMEDSKSGVSYDTRLSPIFLDIRGAIRNRLPGLLEDIGHLSDLIEKNLKGVRV